jgi:hypothetical protein
MTEQAAVAETVPLQACIQEAPNSIWGNKRILKTYIIILLVRKVQLSVFYLNMFVILKYNFNYLPYLHDGMVWTGSNWLRIGTSGWLL